MLKKVVLLFLCCLGIAHADISKPFSPYVDITLDVHWDGVLNNLQPSDIDETATLAGITSLHAGFITDAGQCQPAWGGIKEYPLNWLKHLFQRMSDLNVELIPSFGGAAGVDISQQCSESQLINIFEKTSKLYKAKVLDFDIENGTADVPKLISTLKTFQSQNKNVLISLTLPVMPEGLTYEGQSIIRMAANADLNFTVNIMVMDYGPSYAGDMGQYAIKAATHTAAFLQTVFPRKSSKTIWGKVEITPMIGVNDVSIEQFTLDNAAVLNAFSKSKGIGRLSMWSINRDKPCSDRNANNHCSGNSLQQQDYDFAKALR